MGKQPRHDEAVDVQDKPRGIGRPPGGASGERVRDYPKVMLRLPPETAARLKAWRDISGRPAWQLIAESIEAAISQLEGADAGDVRRLAKRYLRRYADADTA
jgi:predicted DNA-binding protein